MMKKLEDSCENIVVDGAGHYCKILKIPEGEYPHKYRRVFCYGQKNSYSCKNLRDKFGLKNKTN